jgi:hypothetical protein
VTSTASFYHEVYGKHQNQLFSKPFKEASKSTVYHPKITLKKKKISKMLHQKKVTGGGWGYSLVVERGA